MSSFREELKAERDRLLNQHMEAAEREKRIEALEQRGGEKFLEQLRSRLVDDQYKGVEETKERHYAEGGHVQYTVADAELNIVYVFSGDVKYDATSASAYNADLPPWTALRPAVIVTAYRNVSGVRMGGFGAAVHVRAKAGEDAFEFVDLDAAMKRAGSAAIKNFPST